MRTAFRIALILFVILYSAGSFYLGWLLVWGVAQQEWPFYILAAGYFVHTAASGCLAGALWSNSPKLFRAAGTFSVISLLLWFLPFCCLMFVGWTNQG